MLAYALKNQQRAELKVHDRMSESKPLVRTHVKTNVYTDDETRK